MGRARFRVVGLGLALMMVTAGCFGGGGGSASRSSNHSGGSNNGPGCQFIVASEAKRATTPLITQAEYLDAATAAPSVCYDKITFTFAVGNNPDLPPAYTVQYVPVSAPVAPGLTNTATQSLTGVRAMLEVVLHPASETNALNPSNPVQTYKGNLRLQLLGMNHTLIVELLNTFPQPSPDPNQAQVVWLIGLDAKRPFTTDAANAPPQVSVDVMN